MTHPMLEAMRVAGEAATQEWIDNQYKNELTGYVAEASAMLDHLAANITGDQMISVSAALYDSGRDGVDDLVATAIITAYLAAVKAELEQGQ